MHLLVDLNVTAAPLQELAITAASPVGDPVATIRAGSHRSMGWEALHGMRAAGLVTAVLQPRAVLDYRPTFARPTEGSAD